MLRTICFFFLVFLACTDIPRTVRILEEAGYTDIKTTGYEYGTCGKDDSFCTGFIATGLNGHRVTGAVGCGAGCVKACTIRLN